MKLSLLLLLVLVCLALLAFDEGDAFRSKHKRLSRHRASRRRKSSRRVQHTRRKYPKRRRRSSRKSSKTSKLDSSSLSRLHSKLDNFDKKLDRLKLNCDCYKGDHGKNQGLAHLCAEGTMATYEDDSSSFACCLREEDVINGACVTTSCGIRTFIGSSGDGDEVNIRVEDFTLDGSGFSGTFMIGEDDEVVSSGQNITNIFDEGVLFSCTRQGCCELTGEARYFEGTITSYTTQPTPGCNIYIDAECNFPEEEGSGCPCNGRFQFTDVSNVFSYTFGEQVEFEEFEEEEEEEEEEEQEEA